PASVRKSRRVPAGVPACSRSTACFGPWRKAKQSRSPERGSPSRRSSSMFFQKRSWVLTAPRCPDASKVTLPAVESRARGVRMLVAPGGAAPPREFGAAVPVPVQAPAHRERRVLADARHGLHGAVTRLACDAAGDVLTVVEVDEVGKVVDLHPRN